MKSLFVNEKHIGIEVVSALSFIFMSIYMTLTSKAIDQQNILFWIVLFFLFSFLQTVGLVFKNNLMFLRICMTWVSGSVWTWISFYNRESAMIVPMLIIGLWNFVSFVNLCNRASIDWHAILRD